MTFKSTRAPLCRYCGKTINKSLEYVRFGPHMRTTGDTRLRDVRPLSLEEARRHVNGLIASVSWHVPKKMERYGPAVLTGEPKWIQDVGVWDGESYRDGYFCKNACAEMYGRAISKQESEHGLFFKAYRDALEKQHLTLFRKGKL